MNCTPFLSFLWWMILEWITKIRMTLIIWWQALKPRTHSPRIGPVTCIVGLRLPGITPTGCWISQCLVISRKNCMNIDTFNQNVPRRVHTRRHQSNLGWKHKLPFQPMYPPRLDKKGIRNVQRIVRSILYYACAVDMTVLMALSMIASEQMAATEQTFKNTHNYWITLLRTPTQQCNTTHPTWWWTSIWMYHIYQRQKPKVVHADIFSWGGYLKPVNQLYWTGRFMSTRRSYILLLHQPPRWDLGRSAIIANQALFFEASWKNLGHPQPQTPVHCNNATALGIANSTVKRQQSRSI